MTHRQTTLTDARNADRVTLNHVLPQAVDHFPHLLAVRFRLPALMVGDPASAQTSILRFHTRTQQLIGEYAQARIGAGKPSPPTLLRWAWDLQNRQARMVLLLSQDICYHPRYDASIDEGVEDIASLLALAWKDVEPIGALAEFHVFQADRTMPDRFIKAYADLRDALLQMASPVATQ